MRESWVRPVAALSPTRDDVAVLVRAALPDAEVLRIAPVSGGLANSNLRVDIAGASFPRVLVRHWQRAPGEAAKEVALLRRLRGQVPVPTVLAAGAADPLSGLPWAVLSWVEGERLDLALARADAAGQAVLGRATGVVLAAMQDIRFPCTGFLDGELGIGQPIATGRAGLLAYLDRWRSGRGAERLGATLCSRLEAFAVREGHALDAAWATTATLTHADFDGTNILVRGGEVVAVLDWEFAFAGGIAFDLGHLLRPPMGERTGFIAGLAAALGQAGIALPDGWDRAARMADLYSWLDFLERDASPPRLIADARAMVATIIGA